MGADSDSVEELITALPSWQLAVFRFNEAVARSLGIAASDLQCLFVLDRADTRAPGEIARMINLSTGATSRMIDRLVRADLVTREHDRSDRRRVNVAITAEARRALRRLYDPLDDHVRDLLGDTKRGFPTALLHFARTAEQKTIELTAALDSP